MTDTEKHEQLDVDVRFLLANERTLLAWVRTSLAIEAGGLALTQLHKQHMYLGILVMLAGAGVVLMGYHRYYVANRSIRAHRLPPVGIGPAIQVVGIVALAIVLAVAQFVLVHK